MVLRLLLEAMTFLCKQVCNNFDKGSECPVITWSGSGLGHGASWSLVTGNGQGDLAGNWSRPALKARVADITPYMEFQVEVFYKILVP